MIDNINKKELENKIHIYVGVVNRGGAEGEMWPTKKLLTSASFVVEAKKIPKESISYDQEESLKEYKQFFSELGTTAEEIMKKDKLGIKQYAVVISDTYDTESEAISTYAHEVELHLVDEINGNKTSTGQEHRRGYGNAHYDKNKSSDMYSPSDEETDPNSHMGKILKQIYKAILKVENQKSLQPPAKPK